MWIGTLVLKSELLDTRLDDIFCRDQNVDKYVCFVDTKGHVESKYGEERKPKKKSAERGGTAARTDGNEIAIASSRKVKNGMMTMTQTQSERGQRVGDKSNVRGNKLRSDFQVMHNEG